MKGLAQKITNIDDSENIESEECNSVQKDPKESVSVQEKIEDTSTGNTDDPTTVFLKADSAKMSEEDVSKMEQESDSQIKEIFNNHNK